MPNQMQSEIAELNVELEQTDDPREAYAKVQAKIRGTARRESRCRTIWR